MNALKTENEERSQTKRKKKTKNTTLNKNGNFLNLFFIDVLNKFYFSINKKIVKVCCVNQIEHAYQTQRCKIFKLVPINITIDKLCLMNCSILLLLYCMVPSSFSFLNIFFLHLLLRFLPYLLHSNIYHYRTRNNECTLSENMILYHKKALPSKYISC